MKNQHIAMINRINEEELTKTYQFVDAMMQTKQGVRFLDETIDYIKYRSLCSVPQDFLRVGIQSSSSQECLAEGYHEEKEGSWTKSSKRRESKRKGTAHNLFRELSDEEMKQEITNILFDSQNIGISNTDLCQKLAARGVDQSRFKRAVGQMVIRGQAEYRSNKLYLKGTGLQTRGNVVNLVKTIISTYGSIQKDSEEAVRNEVIRLLRLNKNAGLNNAQIISELEKMDFPQNGLIGYVLGWSLTVLQNIMIIDYL